MIYPEIFGQIFTKLEFKKKKPNSSLKHNQHHYTLFSLFVFSSLRIILSYDLKVENSVTEMDVFGVSLMLSPSGFGMDKISPLKERETKDEIQHLFSLPFT